LLTRFIKSGFIEELKRDARISHNLIITLISYFTRLSLRRII
jgi:hypothetical protein